MSVRFRGSRRLGLLLFLACGCPDVGDGASASPELTADRPALDAAVDPLFDPAHFDRLPPPRVGSWRHRVPEPSQSLAEFRAVRKTLEHAQRQTLYLLPLADYPKDPVLPGDLPALPLVEDGFVTFVFAPQPEDLAVFIETFYGLPTRVAEELQLETLVEGPARVRRHHGQFNAPELLAALRPRLPDDAHSLTALMARDLYASDEQEYAFGYAVHQDRVAVASFAQLDPQFIGRGRKDGFRRLIRERAYKLVAHEIGHTLGMEHCDEYRCVMNGVAHVGELDETPLHLGPHCLAKLLESHQRDAVERYESLSELYGRLGLDEAAGWTRERAARLETPGS